MARRRKRHRKLTAKQRKYFAPKKHRRSKPVAKRKRRRKSLSRRIPGQRPRKGLRRRGHRRGGGGGGFALKPSGDDIKLAGASALIGFVETKAKSDAGFFLNKVPKPVDALGYTGNLALFMWVGSHFFKNRWLRLGARAAANITAYHIGRMGKAFTSGSSFFTVAGWSDDEVASALETASMGALNPEGDNMPGVVAYDDADMAY